MFTDAEKRVLELALKLQRGTYEECLRDEALTAEERSAFEADLRTTERMIEAEVWDV
jgi:hypothetical protein